MDKEIAGKLLEIAGYILVFVVPAIWAEWLRRKGKDKEADEVVQIAKAFEKFGPLVLNFIKAGNKGKRMEILEQAGNEISSHCPLGKAEALERIETLVNSKARCLEEKGVRIELDTTGVKLNTDNASKKIQRKFRSFRDKVLDKVL